MSDRNFKDQLMRFSGVEEGKGKKSAPPEKRDVYQKPDRPSRLDMMVDRDERAIDRAKENLAEVPGIKDLLGIHVGYDFHSGDVYDALKRALTGEASPGKGLYTHINVSTEEQKGHIRGILESKFPEADSDTINAMLLAICEVEGTAKQIRDKRKEHVEEKKSQLDELLNKIANFRDIVRILGIKSAGSGPVDADTILEKLREFPPGTSNASLKNRLQDSNKELREWILDAIKIAQSGIKK